MCDLLNRRKRLAEQGYEIFILKGTTNKYYTEVYNQDSVYPILNLYSVGDEYDELLEQIIRTVEQLINN